MTAPLRKPDWQRTWLWETLQKRAKARGNCHASEFMPTLTEWMRHLDAILAKGGTSPLDFTLHDADHSLRVANRIEQLLTPIVRRNLSDYELALLLLAAYGHDIGMTPERGKVLAHHRHLFDHPTTLSDEEKQAYQTFLDEYPERPITLPLGTSPAELDLADELTTFYVRERHNDWGAQWLRESLNPANFGSLPDVVNSLIRLCSSHHWDFQRLRRDDFNPFLSTGPNPQLIHLRFLACLLRLADILENDPERTPHVLLEHRNLQDRRKSLLFWRKDHSFTIDIRNNQLHLQARPPDAHVHKAALELADAIDHELHGIAALGERLPVHNTVGKTNITREWHLAPALTRDIRPADDSYDYIEGAFRPNTARLLQLLSNEQLYGSPLVAVRELLQNAFDAVREKIARIRLDHPAPDIAERKWEQTLGDSEKVTLTLRPGQHGGWLLICEDSGVGLSKALITGHLLVSGNPRRHSIMDLERRCAAKGFQLGRTGQFGIGVLSYFMLAEEVEITTTRSQLCSDNDAPGWTFTTRGVGSFGELRQLPQSPFPAAGTRITWNLLPDKTTDPAQFAIDLLAYLKETLIRIPCRFEFRTEGVPGDQIEWKRSTGWVKTEEDWLVSFQSQIREKKRTRALFHGITLPYQSDERLKDESEADALFESAKDNSLFTLRCELMEFALPDGAGLARYILAYHDLPDGRCVTSRPDIFKDDQEPDTYFSGVSVSHSTITSWKGMDCKVNSPMFLGSFHFKVASVEIDIEDIDSNSVSISRQGVSLPDDIVAQWEHFLETVTETWVDEVLSGPADSSDLLHEVNLSHQGRPLDLTEGAKWFHFDGAAPFRAIQRPIALPITHFGMRYKTNHGRTTRLDDSSKEPVAIVIGGQDRSKIKSDCELRFLQTPDSERQIPCLYWPAGAAKHESIFKRFPQEWRDVGLIQITNRTGTVLSSDTNLLFLNHSHPFVRLLGNNDERASKLLRSHRPLVWQALDEASSAELAAIAFCRIILDSSYATPEQWKTYSKQRSLHLEQLWSLISKETGLPLNSLRLIATNGRTDVEISPNGLFLQNSLDPGPPLLPRVKDPDFLLH